MQYIQSIPEIAVLLEDANHMDVKVIESTVNLREFSAAMLRHQPGWVTALFGIRAVFVRFLGMKQERVRVPRPQSSADVSLTPGDPAYFFTVKLAKEAEYLVWEIKDRHLDAILGVVAEPLDAKRKRFHVMTVVHYNNWAGPVYFNVIRLFHHVVVGSMVRAGARGLDRAADEASNHGG